MAAGAGIRTLSTLFVLKQESVLAGITAGSVGASAAGVSAAGTAAHAEVVSWVAAVT
jgi:hypothetical protein